MCLFFCLLKNFPSQFFYHIRAKVCFREIERACLFLKRELFQSTREQQKKVVYSFVSCSSLKLVSCSSWERERDRKFERDAIFGTDWGKGFLLTIYTDICVFHVSKSHSEKLLNSKCLWKKKKKIPISFFAPPKLHFSKVGEKTPFSFFFVSFRRGSDDLIYVKRLAALAPRPFFICFWCANNLLPSWRSSAGPLFLYFQIITSLNGRQ